MKTEVGMAKGITNKFKKGGFNLNDLDSQASNMAGVQKIISHWNPLAVTYPFPVTTV